MVWLLLGGLAQAQEPAHLDDFLRLAEAGHPRLKATRSQTETLGHQADLAGSLPDLKLAWGEMIRARGDAGGAPAAGLLHFQSLPWFGTLGSEGRRRKYAAMPPSPGNRPPAWRCAARFTAPSSRWPVCRPSRIWCGAGGPPSAAGNGGPGGLRDRRWPLRCLLKLQMSGNAFRLDWPPWRMLWSRQRPPWRWPPVCPRRALPPLGPGCPSAGSLPGREDLVAGIRGRNPTLEGLRLQEQSFGRDVQTARLQGKPGLTLGLDYIMTARRPCPEPRTAARIPSWPGWR